jgi:CheY-like chemotaxis protein
MGSPARTSPVPHQAAVKRVLVVEDDDDLRDSLVELVAGEGFQVESAKSGLEALDKLRWGLRPSLILLDLRMDVMTGWEFRNEQKRDPELAGIPVIAMTGGAWKMQDMDEFAACLFKPVSPEVLQRKLRLFCA